MTGRPKKKKPSIPQTLQDYPFWILWKLVDRQGKKPIKVPLDFKGKKANGIEFSGSYEEAIAASIGLSVGQRNKIHPGIYISKDVPCPILCVDIDDVSEWENPDEAEELVDGLFELGIVERSQSGNGYHIFIQYDPEKHDYIGNMKTAHKSFFRGKVQVYKDLRFIAVTGKDIEGELHKLSARERSILDQFLNPLVNTDEYEDEIDIYDLPKVLPSYRQMSDEAVLLEMAGTAERTDEHSASNKFMRLRKDPDALIDAEDASDFVTSALCSLITVTKDPEQIERIMMGCAAEPQFIDKNTNQPKMRRWLASQLPRLLKRKIHEEKVEKEEARKQIEEHEYLEHFVFIEPQNKFFNMRSKELYTIEALSNTYRNRHTGTRGDPTLSALLLGSDDLVRVDGLTWYPEPYRDGDSPNSFKTASESIVREGRKSCINLWDGFAVEPKEGSVEPFLKLVHHLIRDPELEHHLIQRMAFDVQYPHKKCKWHVAIFGTHGAGKDSVISILGEIFGKAYSPTTNDAMKSGYEDEFIAKKIIHTEEASSLNKSTMERLKSYMTAHEKSSFSMNKKGEGKVDTFAVWSFYFTGNDKDAMYIERTERRFLILEANHAMPEELREEFYSWKDYEDGAAKLFRYLLDVDLSDFKIDETPVRTQAFEDMVSNTSRIGTDITQYFFDNSGSRLLEFGALDRNAVLMFMDPSRKRGIRKVDVSGELEVRGWKTIENLRSAKAGNYRMAGHWMAPKDSPLHGMKGVDLIEALEEIKREIVSSDFGLYD